MLLLFFLASAAASTAPVTGDGQPAPLTSTSPLDYSCNDTGVYQNMFQANLDEFSATVTANASASDGFFKGSFGSAPNKVYVRALCRGDTAGADCTACLETAFQNPVRNCTNAKEAIVFYDKCQIQFSDVDFIAGASNKPMSSGWGAENIAVPLFSGGDDNTSAAFTTATVSMLLRETARLAAYNASRRYATAVMDTAGGAFPTLYSMAQCTPDLSPDDCFACLEDTMLCTPSSNYQRQGGRIIGARCFFRYESAPFYGGNAMWSFGAPPGRQSKNKWIIAVVALSLMMLTSSIIIGFLWIRLRRKVPLQVKPRQDLHLDEEPLVWSMEAGKATSAIWLFDFAQIQEATSNFSIENKLGQGGFGPVYKGKLPDGLEIAVKRLSTNSGQGFIEFKNEVQLIAQLQHTNLVRLLGCCCQEKEKMLVYEYLPNKSLDFFIFEEHEKRAILDWGKRLKIIEGIAHGLLYLHKHSRLRIVHRDLKASNILLDQNMIPKISDFGIARIFISNDIEDNTNTVVGTYGYMAPEYAYEGLYSNKSDVFSFGVLLIEIVSGKRNSVVRRNGGFLNLLGYAWIQWKGGKWHELVDTSLKMEHCASEVLKCVNIALLCVQDNATHRPSMWDVATMLSTDGASLPEPNHPAYYSEKVANGEH